MQRLGWILGSISAIVSVPVAYGIGMSTATLPTNLFTSPGAVTTFLCTLLGWMYWALIVLSVAMFLWGGYTYATAGDKPDQVSKANKILLYAAIAIIVAIVANTVPILIASLFGISISTC